jgi:hypothetical protein
MKNEELSECVFRSVSESAFPRLINAKPPVSSRVRRRSLGLLAGSMLLLVPEAPGGGPYQFYSVAPCRIVDTRGPVGVNGGPALASGAPRGFSIRGSCGIPLTAQAAAFNVTMVAPTQNGYLKVWPYGTAAPGTSNVNAPANALAIANGALVSFASDPTLQVSIVYGTVQPGTAHVVLDVTGYFQ